MYRSVTRTIVIFRARDIARAWVSKPYLMMDSELRLSLQAKPEPCSLGSRVHIKGATGVIGAALKYADQLLYQQRYISVSWRRLDFLLWSGIESALTVYIDNRRTYVLLATLST